MQLMNNSERYGVISKTFHVLIAIFIIVLLLVGLSFSFVPKEWIGFMMPIHKSAGLTVMLLVVLWLIWRAFDPRPPFPSTMPAWQKPVAKITHALLYVLVIAMPWSGLVMSSAAGVPTLFWYWLNVTLPIAPDKQLAMLANSAHYYIAWAITALVTLHLLAALKHHFIDKDNVLKAMLPFGK